MEISSLGFIGAGNMNTAILQGVLRAGAIPREQIWLSNRHKEKLEPFSGTGIHTTLDNREVVLHTDVVVIGVKPQMFGDVLPGIALWPQGNVSSPSRRASPLPLCGRLFRERPWSGPCPTRL